MFVVRTSNLLSCAWGLLACLLPDRQFSLSSINGCKKFEILLILFFHKLYGFLVVVPTSYIGIIFMYRLTCLYLTCLHIPCYYLSPDWYHLLSCCHLTSSMTYLTLIIITIIGMMTWHLDYILIYPEIFQYKLYSWYTCTLVTPDMFLSFLKSNNYLINHKMGQLTSGRGKLVDINTYSCLQ